MKHPPCSFATIPALLALLVSCAKENATTAEHDPPDSGPHAPAASTRTSSSRGVDAAVTITANGANDSSVSGEQEKTSAADTGPGANGFDASIANASSNITTSNITAGADASTIAASTDTSGSPRTDESAQLERKYDEQLCAYYLRCAPTATAGYGADVQACAESNRIARRMAELSLDSRLEVTQTWDLACVLSTNVGALECPIIQGREPVFTDVAQHLHQHIGHCLSRDLPCRGDDDCLLGGVCGNGGEVCGRCEPEPNKCLSYIDCSFGETCVDSACVPLAANGEACDSPYECLGQACVDNKCTNAKAEGAQCEHSQECFTSLRCHAGTCSKPGDLGDVCDGGTTLFACKFGLECLEEVCQQAGIVGVPVGGVCFGVASCVAYAECSGSVCKPSENMCTRDAQCGALEYCEQECFPKKVLGDNCSSHHACVSGFCTNEGVCADPAECH